MSVIASLIRREFAAWLHDPLHGICLLTLPATCAWIFLHSFEELAFPSFSVLSGRDPLVRFQIDAHVMQPYWATCAWISTLLIPLISSRAFAADYKSGFFLALRSMRVSPLEWLIGKWIGASLYLLILLSLLLPAISPAFFYSKPNIPLVFFSLLGLYCHFQVVLCVSFFFSSLSRGVLSALVASFGTLILLWSLHLISEPSMNSFDSSVYFFGLGNHLHNLLRGTPSLQDVLYYVGMVLIGIVMTLHVSREWEST